ncbi:MAG: hypothetical protein IT518_07670 [Burkholderiales bacterium]|nr:hypothetical protein [Burkholderiales bacterium]
MSRTKPQFAPNWAPLRDWIGGERADLIVHTGDLTVDGAGGDARHGGREHAHAVCTHMLKLAWDRRDEYVFRAPPLAESASSRSPRTSSSARARGSPTPTCRCTRTAS